MSRFKIVRLNQNGDVVHALASVPTLEMAINKVESSLEINTNSIYRIDEVKHTLLMKRENTPIKIEYTDLTDGKE